MCYTDYYSEHLMKSLQSILSRDGCQVNYIRKYLKSPSDEEIEKLKRLLVTSAQVYTNYSTIELLRCFFNIFIVGELPFNFKDNTDSNTGKGIRRVEKLITGGSLIEKKEQSTPRPKDSDDPLMLDAAVYKADVLGESDRFILKTNNDSRIILFEYFIGAYGTNTLRKTLPNFALVSSILSCGYKKKGKLSSESIRYLCEPTEDEGSIPFEYRGAIKTNYILYERVPGVSLREYMDSDECEVGVLLNYFQQILVALQFAYDEIGFVHRDLHSSNVILRDRTTPPPGNEKENAVVYTINNTTYSFKTDKIPTLIDYGYSSITYDGLTYVTPATDASNYKIFSLITFPGYDMYKLTMDIIYNLSFSKRKGVFDSVVWLADFYKGIDPYHPKGRPSVDSLQDESDMKDIRDLGFFLKVEDIHHYPALKKTPLEMYYFIQQHYTQLSPSIPKQVKNKETKFDLLFDRVVDYLKIRLLLPPKCKGDDEKCKELEIDRMLTVLGRILLSFSPGGGGGVTFSQSYYFLHQILRICLFLKEQTGRKGEITDLERGVGEAINNLKSRDQLAMQDLDLLEALNSHYNEVDVARDGEILKKVMIRTLELDTTQLRTYFSSPRESGSLKIVLRRPSTELVRKSSIRASTKLIKMPSIKPKGTTSSSFLEEVRGLTAIDLFSFHSTLRQIMYYDNCLHFVKATDIKDVKIRTRFSHLLIGFNEVKNRLCYGIYPIVASLRLSLSDNYSQMTCEWLSNASKGKEIEIPVTLTETVKKLELDFSNRDPLPTGEEKCSLY